MKIYYETTHDDGGEFPILTAHETIEEAIEFAEANGIKTIYEVGGSFDEFEKCEFCGEWYTTEELNNGICWRCKLAIWSRGEEV